MSRRAVFFLLVLFPIHIFLTRCSPRKEAEFSYDKNGYYYKLLYFADDGLAHTKWEMARVNVVFKTQKDSVFWDSYNNLSDNFFVRYTRSDSAGLLDKCVSSFMLNDSVCMLMNVGDFYREQFATSRVPYFSQNDTVVKINFKIKELLTYKEFAHIKVDLERRELGRMAVFFGSRQDVESARDSLGFYWVEKPEDTGGEPVKEGDRIILSYQGSFLNGRFLEKSPADFELVYGTPDQLLKGINYVIRRLKVGQNAKIILPSRLAFGEKGSSNGTVPPFTPLLYEIQIKQIKNN